MLTYNRSTPHLCGGILQKTRYNKSDSQTIVCESLLAIQISLFHIKKDPVCINIILILLVSI